MKKIILILIMWSAFAIAQAQSEVTENPIEKPKIKISLAGGAMTFFGKDVMFIGFLGPKVSMTLQTKKVGYEIGLNGFPGLIISYQGKVLPGLALGSTLTFKTKSKIKPCIGFAVAYSQERWQPMGGVGFSF